MFFTVLNNLIFFKERTDVNVDVGSFLFTNDYFCFAVSYMILLAYNSTKEIFMKKNSTHVTKRLISKEIKDQYPDVYGYPTAEHLNSYIKVIDADGDTRYIPCNEQIFKKYDTLRRDEARRQDESSRCLLPSTRYTGLVVCRDNCKCCPLGRDSRIPPSVSIEKIAESGKEISLDSLTKTDDKLFLKSIFQQLDGADKLLLLQLYQGFTNKEIAKFLGITESALAKRRQRLFGQIQRKYHDNQL